MHITRCIAALSLVLVAAGCSKTTENTTEEVATEVEDATEAVEEDAAEAEDTAEADTAEADTAEAEAEADTENAATAEGVMSYADYVAAAVDTPAPEMSWYRWPLGNAASPSWSRTESGFLG